MDPARTVFDSIGDAAAIRQLVDDRVQENLYLELGPGQMDKPVEDVLIKSITKAEAKK